MKPQLPDDAILPPVTERAPARRRMPVGTAQHAVVAEGTVPVRLPSARPWLRFTIASVIVLSIATIAAYVLYVRAARQEAFEAQYPVVASAPDADVIARQAARWSAGEPRLLRSLAAFTAPSLESLVGAGGCPFTGPGVTVAVASDLGPTVREAIAAILASANRGRFASEAAVTEVIGQLTGPLVVTARGIRYAFDPATGELACAGTGVLRAVE